MISHPSSAPSLRRAANVLRVQVLVYWVSTLIVAAESAVGGLWWDLGRIPYVRETLTHLGYPLYFATIMGVAKRLAVAVLLVPRLPRLKEWAYAGVSFVYVGAAASHFAVGEPTSKVLTRWSSPWSRWPPGRRAHRPAATPRPWTLPASPTGRQPPLRPPKEAPDDRPHRQRHRQAARQPARHLGADRRATPPRTGRRLDPAAARAGLAG